MTASINGTDNIQLMMAQMYQKLNAANTDGVSGLSKKELSSINPGDDVGGAAFLKSLTEQFEALDKNQNGQLSAQEIFPPNVLNGQMGMPPGLDLNSRAGNSFNFNGVFGDLKDFAQKLINSYKNGGLSSIASSVNIAG